METHLEHAIAYGLDVAHRPSRSQAPPKPDGDPGLGVVVPQRAEPRLVFVCLQYLDTYGCILEDTLWHVFHSCSSAYSSSAWMPRTESRSTAMRTAALDTISSITLSLSSSYGLIPEW